jgi:hypothetical protein
MPDFSVRAVAERAASLLLSRPPSLGDTRLGVVDGPSGSGKTTFARLWEQVLIRRGDASVLLFSSDLLATWADPFGWFDRFDADVLTPLAAGRPGRIQLTDWTAGEPRPGRSVDIPVVDVLLLEGVSVARLALGNRAGVTVWVEVAGRAQRLERAVARDGEVSRIHLTSWQDAEDAFFERDRPAERADFCIDMPFSGVAPDPGGPEVASRSAEGMLGP